MSEHIVEQLGAYLDGELHNRQLQKVEAHLTECETCRAVLVLREYEGLSYQEIAASLDIPVGTVMSRLNYARNLLKEKLNAQLFSYAEAENV